MDRPIFSDRTSAGDALARNILETGKVFDVALGLARGGIPVAVPVAKALHVPLFPMIARKIGAPWERELALGALSENGGLYWNRELIESMDISPEAMERLVDKARKEIREKISRLRWGKSLPALSGKRIVLVDDGAATGATNFAAITDILAEEPEQLLWRFLSPRLNSKKRSAAWEENPWCFIPLQIFGPWGNGMNGSPK